MVGGGAPGWTTRRPNPNAGRVEVSLAPRRRGPVLRSARAFLRAGVAGDAAASSDLPFRELGLRRSTITGTTPGRPCESSTDGAGRRGVRASASVLARTEGPILVSRTSREHVDGSAAAAGTAVEIVERPRARCVALRRATPPGAGTVLIMTAGTSDLGVAEEAELTASLLGAETEIVADVGVAGLHRLVAAQPTLATADAVVVVAGMEGALASVVGGIAACPVIACPTSVGYGASLGGCRALSMLSSWRRESPVSTRRRRGSGTIAALIARRRCRDERLTSTSSRRRGRHAPGRPARRRGIARRGLRRGVRGPGPAS